jgi:hypothetical protein
MAEYLVYLDGSFGGYSGIYEAKDEKDAVQQFSTDYDYAEFTPDETFVVLNLCDAQHYKISTKVSITPV